MPIKMWRFFNALRTKKSAIQSFVNSLSFFVQNKNIINEPEFSKSHFACVAEENCGVAQQPKKILQLCDIKKNFDEFYLKFT